jgi:hypothetical protein
MVRRFRAFLVAVVWVALGLATVIVALTLSARGLGDEGVITAVVNAFRDYLRWWLYLMGACLTIALIWIIVAKRHAPSSAALGAQGALIGMAAALTVLLLVLIAGQVLGSPLL